MTEIAVQEQSNSVGFIGLSRLFPGLPTLCPEVPANSSSHNITRSGFITQEIESITHTQRIPLGDYISACVKNSEIIDALHSYPRINMIFQQ